MCDYVVELHTIRDRLALGAVRVGSAHWPGVVAGVSEG